MLEQRYLLYVDGCSMLDGCSMGYVLVYQKQEVASGSKTLNPRNIILNVEYTSILEALDEMLHLGVQKQSLVVRNDNQQVISGLRSLNPKGIKGIIQAEYHFKDLEFVWEKRNDRWIKKCHSLAHGALSKSRLNLNEVELYLNGDSKE